MGVLPPLDPVDKAGMTKLITAIANECYGHMHRLKRFRDYLNGMTDDDFTVTLGYTTEQKNEIRSFEEAIYNIFRMYNFESKIGTADPGYTIDRMADGIPL